MIAFGLAWPPKDLSPNLARNIHWSRKAKAIKQYRTGACYAAMGQLAIGQPSQLAAAPYLQVSLVFVPPDRRPRDLDNLIGAVKSGLDGIADGLGVNDRKFRLSAHIGEPERNPCVRVTVETAEEVEARNGR